MGEVHHLSAPTHAPLFASLRDAQRFHPALRGLLCEAKEDRQMPTKKVRLTCSGLSEEEYRLIKASARQAGMTAARFITMTALNIRPRAKTDFEACKTLLKELANLARLGNLYKEEIKGALDAGMDQRHLVKLEEQRLKIANLADKISATVNTVLKN